MKHFSERVRSHTAPGALRFGFITDVHCEAGPDPAGYGASSLAQLFRFSRGVRECGGEFLVSGGDLNNGNRPKSRTVREIRAAGYALRSGGLPVCFVMGNHDDNTYFCRDNGRGPAEGLTCGEWMALAEGGVPFPGLAAAPETPGCGYFDLPGYRLRVLVLNTVDLPFATKPDGTLKYFTINDHAFSQAQLDFVARTALDFSRLPESKQWGLLVLSHIRFAYLPNGGVMTGLLDAFRRGGRYESTPAEVGAAPYDADPADLGSRVSADFTRQGPREIVAHLYGHEHLDEVRPGPGWPEVTFLNALCYQNTPERPERRFGTPSEDAWSIVAIDRGRRELSVFRHGAGDDFQVKF